MNKIYSCLKDRNPFEEDSQLMYVSNGMHANSLVNIENAKDIYRNKDT